MEVAALPESEKTDTQNFPKDLGPKDVSVDGLSLADTSNIQDVSSEHDMEGTVDIGPVDMTEGMPPKPQKTTKIMCLGDSISEGINTSTTYRSYLYFDLKKAGYKFDFVGVNRGTCGSIDEGDKNGWDSDHCSYFSARASEILGGNMPKNRCSPAGSGNLRTWAPALKPDIAIVHLGTNDCRGSHPRSDKSEL